MAMDWFTKDMNIIQKLNDEPNDRDGLTAGELKAKFDEGGLAVKDYLNNTVKPYVDGMETTEAEHEADTNNPHSVTKTQVGLGSVPNVSTNNQTPTYTAASSLTALVSGEKLGTAFGKLAKAVSDLISHIGNGAIHFTAAERAKLSGIETGAEVNSITGVKGNAESSYRTGNVNLTPANIGAAAASHTHALGDLPTITIAKGGTGATSASAAITALGGPDITGQGTRIPNNTDLNTLVTPGTYKSQASANSATMPNAPWTSAGFKLFVVQGHWEYAVKQIALGDQVLYIRSTQDAGSTWTAWAPGATKVHTHAASDISSGTLPVARGGTGNSTGYVTAGKKSGTTLGTGATAEGGSTTASGSRSHAEGLGTVASGDYSHAEGNGTVAGGDYSHAEGSNTTASGMWSHAEGLGTTAGRYAHAEGAATTASGEISHAEGNNTIAAGDCQHVFGKYNISNTTDVEIVGWGTSSTRKNIRTLANNGNMTIAGTLTQSSDARLKDVQGEVPDLSSVRAVRFRWNDAKGAHDDKDHIGYIAQDVEQIAPFLVGDDSNGYKSLDYIALLCAKVEWLERKVKALQTAAETEGGN